MVKLKFVHIAPFQELGHHVHFNWFVCCLFHRITNKIPQGSIPGSAVFSLCIWIYTPSFWCRFSLKQIFILCCTLHRFQLLICFSQLFYPLWIDNTIDSSIYRGIVFLSKLPFSWMAVWATSGSLLRRASVTAAFCWTRSQAAPSDGLEEDGFSPSSSSSRSIPKRHNNKNRLAEQETKESKVSRRIEHHRDSTNSTARKKHIHNETHNQKMKTENRKAVS